MSEMQDPILEGRLVALGRDVDYPAAVDVTARVVARIRAEAATVQPLRSRDRAWQPAIAAGFVLLLAIALLLTAWPGAREAVADLLGFSRLRIEVRDGPESPRPRATAGETLLLGERADLDRALSVFGSVPLADEAVFGAPDGFFIEDSLPMLSIVYGPGPGRPAVAGDGVSVLITALGGHLYEGFAQKVLHTGEATIRPITVRGHSGYWVRGEHAFFVYVGSDDAEKVESARIANNVLVWEERGLILRIEGELTRAQALSIAEGMRLQS